MSYLLTRDEIATILGIDDPTDIPAEVVAWGEEEVEKVLNLTFDSISGAEAMFFLTIQTQTFLELPFKDNMEVTKIEYYNRDSETWTTIASTDYYFEVDSSMVFFDYSLYRQLRYKVTYSYGGSSVNDLHKKLHLLLVLNYLQKFKSDVLASGSVASGEIKKETIGDYSVEFNVGTSNTSISKVESSISELTILLGGSLDSNDVGMI